MIDQFLAGEDLHNKLATAIYGPDFTSAQRTTAKNSWFSKAYGASVQKFADTAGIELELAESVYAALDTEYPGIAAFQNYVIDTGKERLRSEGRGYIRLSDGTELPSDPGEEYALVDYVLQGEAAKIMKRAAVGLDNAGFGDWMRMFIHDEVVFEIPKDVVAEAQREIEVVMSDADTYAVPINVEGTLCPTSWGSKYS